MSAAATVTDFPDDTSCWLCLEEGPDESGKPLVRDCSCRGSSGVAHISCITKYAKSESRRLHERDGAVNSCVRPFYKCPNCKQSYQNDLHKTLAKVCVEFVESELDVDGDGFLLMHVLLNQMGTLDAQDVDDNVDAEAIVAKFISAQKRFESKLLDGLNEQAKRYVQNVVANGYATIATFYAKNASPEGLLRALGFFEKASDIFKTMGTMDAQIFQTAVDKNISDIGRSLVLVATWWMVKVPMAIILVLNFTSKNIRCALTIMEKMPPYQFPWE